jgi:hypothetical protein
MKIMYGVQLRDYIKQENTGKILEQVCKKILDLLRGTANDVDKLEL